jgi:hypothetical protein
MYFKDDKFNKATDTTFLFIKLWSCTLLLALLNSHGQSQSDAPTTMTLQVAYYNDSLMPGSESVFTLGCLLWKRKKRWEKCEESNV